MKLLRIRVPATASPLECEWALVDADGETVRGVSALSEIPCDDAHVQLVLAAADVLITRIEVPAAVVRRGGAALAYALEDSIVQDPESQAVSCLASEGDSHVVAVYDRDALQPWIEALSALGLARPELLCETLLLPQLADEWSLAWNGTEGYVRTGEWEGAATDCGNTDVPPVMLVMMLNAAAVQKRLPQAIALYPSDPACIPDVAAWQHRLDIPLRVADERWDWSFAPFDSGGAVLDRRARWRVSPATVTRLKPAAYILGAALAVHLAALTGHWLVLSHDCRVLQQQMVDRFRSVFPDTVAVVDPALQMRRKLSEARHRVGVPDDADFLPMIDTVAAALGDLPPGTVRLSSYEAGRLTLELAQLDENHLRQIVARVRQAGLEISRAPQPGRGVVLTVRSS